MDPGEIQRDLALCLPQADRNFIVIKFPSGTVRISREHVLLIQPYDGWMSKGQVLVGRRRS